MLKAQLELHEKEFARLEATSGAKISELHALVQMERDKVRAHHLALRIYAPCPLVQHQFGLQLYTKTPHAVLLLWGHRCVGMRSWRRSWMTPSSAPACTRAAKVRPLKPFLIQDDTFQECGVSRGQRALGDA
jgi:hypothetical protein